MQINSKKHIFLKIQELCGNLLGTDNIKFIFITTDGTISSDSEVIEFLAEKIPSLPIIIKPFEEKDFFLDILLNIYKLDNITREELESLFKICNGTPEKLKIFYEICICQRALNMIVIVR